MVFLSCRWNRGRVCIPHGYQRHEGSRRRKALPASHSQCGSAAVTAGVAVGVPLIELGLMYLYSINKKGIEERGNKTTDMESRPWQLPSPPGACAQGERVGWGWLELLISGPAAPKCRTSLCGVSCHWLKLYFIRPGTQHKPAPLPGAQAKRKKKSVPCTQGKRTVPASWRGSACHPWGALEPGLGLLCSPLPRRPEPSIGTGCGPTVHCRQRG